MLLLYNQEIISSGPKHLFAGSLFICSLINETQGFLFLLTFPFLV